MTAPSISRIATGQSRRWSLIEAFVNVVVGYGLSVGMQALFFRALGIDAPMGAITAFGGVMTIVSVCRSYAIRRGFNGIRR